MMVDPNTSFLFVSYASSDRERAGEVVASLEAAGVPVWIDQVGISAGATWAGAIVSAIRNCQAVAVLCSAASLSSRNVRQELQLAWDHDRPIFPVLIESVTFPDDVSYFLQGRQWIDASDQTDASWIADLSAAFFGLGAQAPHRVEQSETQKAHPLPAPVMPLVGRDQEIEDIIGRLLGGSRLITLTGPGGVGKTRLALEIAHRVVESFAGDVAFVDVSRVNHPDHVPPTIAQTIGVRESAQHPIGDTLAQALRTRRLLLVLDNFEQVIEAAPIVAGLVTNTQQMVILVTSREALRVRGEDVVAILPLDLPTPQETFDIEALSRLAVVKLLLQTAREVKPGFDLTPANAPAILEICRRLDGLPLAIELAASRLRYFPPATLLEHLDRRLPVLAGGSRDLPARHQTLRDTIAWSYDLLAPGEQTLFRRIGAFPAGASLAALDIYAQVAGTPEQDLLTGLASLVDKSLIRERLGANDTLRFVMLETIREFAGEMTEQLDELHTHRSAIVASAVEFVRPGQGGVLAWLGSAASLREIDDELDNVRSGFVIAAEQGDAESCAILFTGIFGYLLVRGLYREASTMGGRVLELAETVPISELLRGRTLTDLSYFCTTLGDLARAEQMASEGLALTLAASDDETLLISALDGMIIALREQGRFTEALMYAEEADQLASKLDDDLIRGSTKYFLGNICRLLDDRVRTVTYLLEAMALSQGNEIGIYAGSDLVDFYLRQGQVRDAAAALRQVMRWWQEAGSGVNGRPLDRAAMLAAASGRAELAAKLFALNSVQNAMYGMRDRDDQWTAGAIETARNQLGRDAFESAFQAGNSLTLQQATMLALEMMDQIEAVT